MTVAVRIFTIGHSNHAVEFFIALLKQHGIEVLVDARSRPYSRYVPHFNRESLKELLPVEGLQYLYMGDQLGGRSEGNAPFLQGLERLIAGAGKFRVAVMCAEEDPAKCHRHLLLAPALVERGVCVEHIRKDGSIEEACPQPDRKSVV